MIVFVMAEHDGFESASELYSLFANVKNLCFQLQEYRDLSSQTKCFSYLFSRACISFPVYYWWGWTCHQNIG